MGFFHPEDMDHLRDTCGFAAGGHNDDVRCHRGLPYRLRLQIFIDYSMDRVKGDCLKGRGEKQSDVFRLQTGCLKHSGIGAFYGCL